MTNKKCFRWNFRLMYFLTAKQQYSSQNDFSMLLNSIILLEVCLASDTFFSLLLGISPDSWCILRVNLLKIKIFFKNIKSLLGALSGSFWDTLGGTFGLILRALLVTLSGSVWDHYYNSISLWPTETMFWIFFLNCFETIKNFHNKTSIKYLYLSYRQLF